MSDFPEQRALNRLIRWYRRRRFITAYRILRNEAERHQAAGHPMRLSATNQAHFHMECPDCPWYRWSNNG